MAYQPKSYRKFLATGVATAMVATAVAPAVSADQHTDFTDIEDVRSWAGDAIDYLVEKGAIQGMGTPGIFNPQGELTRGQAASLLANTLGLDVDEDATSGFDDLAGHWSDAYVAAIQAELPGVIDGYTDGTFRPETDITRQEMAKITVEAFDLEVNADADVDFSDNSSWGAEYVEVLASLGILGGYTDGTIRPEADITRAEAAVFVHRTEVPSVRLGQDEVAELAVESVSAINPTTLSFAFNSEVDADSELTFSVDGDEVDADDVEYDENYAWVTVDELEDGEEYDLLVETPDADEDAEDAVVVYEETYTFDAEAYATAAVEAYEEVDAEEITHYSQVEAVEQLEETARAFVGVVADEDVRDDLLERTDEVADEVNEQLDGFVDAVADAGNQLDLLEALDAFWDADEDLITTYAALVFDDGVDIGDVHEIQENVIEAAVMGATDAQIREAIEDTLGNLSQFRSVMNEYEDAFERVNTSNTHLSAYMNALNDNGDFVAGIDSVSDIQDVIDAENLTLATSAVLTAEGDVERSEWNTAQTLVSALDDEDQEDDKEALQDRLDDHDLVIKVSEARNTTAFADALEGLEDHSDFEADFDATVYEALLSEYHSGLADIDGDDKNTVLKLSNIHIAVNEAEQLSVLQDIEAVDGDTSESNLMGYFERLESITPDVSDAGGFDLSIVNNDWASDYLAEFQGLATDAIVSDGATAGDIVAGVGNVISEIETVNETKEATARGTLETVDPAATDAADDVFGALQDLLLEDLDSANKDFYLAEVVDFSADFTDTTAGGSYTVTIVTIQSEIVDEGNEVAAVITAETRSEMRVAIAPFGDNDYVNLSTGLKNDVSYILLADIELFVDEDTDVVGDYDNHSGVTTTLTEVVSEVENFIIDGVASTATNAAHGHVNSPDLDISDMIALLNNDTVTGGDRDYITFGDFEELSAFQKQVVAEYVLDNRPTVTNDDGEVIANAGYRTVAAVEEAIAEGIASLD